MQVAIDRMSEALRCCSHFDHLLALCSADNAYLVGGALRDVLTGRPVTDLDLVFPHDPTAIAREFARQIDGHWFWLDQQRCQCRVIGRHSKSCLNYDFACFRAATLEKDLADRDFTINALALPLAGDLSGATLIDPCRGLDDLRQNLLRMVGSESFINDPLRIVKGIRHATILNMAIESETQRCMRVGAAGLVHVAPERIRQEIWKLLSDRNAGRGLLLLIKSGAGTQLFGSDFASSWPLPAERLERCRERWRSLAHHQPVIADWLTREVEQGLTIDNLLLFVFLLAAVDRKLPDQLAEQWKLSSRARTAIASLSAMDASILREFSDIACNGRAYAWWSMRYHVDPRLLMLALAVLPGAESFAEELAAAVPHLIALVDTRPPDLVDGHWLRNALSLKEGPEMSQALELLRDAEIKGVVASTDDARRFLLYHFQNRD